MREDLAASLRCPACRATGSLGVDVVTRDAREIQTGTLTCAKCGHAAGIREGIVDLLHDPPEFVVKEAAGLTRFVDRALIPDGWTRERVLALPYEQSGYWYAQATLMHQVLATVDFQPGDRVLDVGSNTCWASAMFAERKLDVVALDITEQEYQGLRTARWWMDEKDVFFERVLGVMFDLPFADESFDFVWCCEVLHHNHRENLARTFEELHRILRPGGQLVVANEPLRTLGTPKLRPGHEVAEWEGHEHAYVRTSYTALARRAGFDVDVRGPWLHQPFRTDDIVIRHRDSRRQVLKRLGILAARRIKPVNRTYLAWRMFLRGETSLHMVCTKPAS